MIYNRLIVAAIGFIRLEPYDGKLSRTVLRGGAGSNASLLPDIIKGYYFPVIHSNPLFFLYLAEKRKIQLANFSVYGTIGNDCNAFVCN